MAIGQQVNAGLALQDSDYVNGLAQGQNATNQSMTAFAGGGQASATKIQPAAQVISIDTVATAGDSVKLPNAVKGQVKMVYNNTATSANLFGANSTDTINGTVGSTAYAIAANIAVTFFCPKNGIWAANKSA